MAEPATARRTPRPSQAGERRARPRVRVAPARGLRRALRRPPAVAAVIVVPSSMRCSAASGTPRSWQRPDRAARTRGSDATTPTRSVAGLLAAAGNSAIIAGLSTVMVVLFAALAAFVFARRSSRSRGPVHAVHAGPAVPGGGRDPAPVHPRPRPGTAEQPARAGPARGGLRAAPHDRHPPAVLPEHPEGARGRRVDRRLRVVRLLLPDPAAAVASRSWSRSRCWPSCRAGTSSCCRW